MSILKLYPVHPSLRVGGTKVANAESQDLTDVPGTAGGGSEKNASMAVAWVIGKEKANNAFQETHLAHLA